MYMPKVAYRVDNLRNNTAILFASSQSYNVLSLLALDHILNHPTVFYALPSFSQHLL